MTAGMDARRAKQAAATATPAAAAPAPAVAKPAKAAAAPAAKPAAKAAPKPAAPKKAKSDLKGPMKSIQNGKAYLEYVAPVEGDLSPTKRSVFDLGGRSAKAVDDSTGKERVLAYRTLLAHLNETVNKKVFGAALRPKVFKMQMMGIVDQILTLVEQDRKVKLANFVTVQKVARQARQARNPRNPAQVIQVAARTTMKATAAKPAKAFLNGGV